MGNCCCLREPSIQSVFPNAKPVDFFSLSKYGSSSGKSRKGYIVKLPSTPAEVEDLRRRMAANPLIVFSFNVLRTMTGNFRDDYMLGRGGFGSVYKGYICDDLGQGLEPIPVAVKVHGGNKSLQGHREWLAEVIMLGQLSHPNLVKLIGYCCEDKHWVLIYEYMCRGSVEDNLFSIVAELSVPLPWCTRMKIAFGAAKGLAFLLDAEKPVI